MMWIQDFVITIMNPIYFIEALIAFIISFFFLKKYILLALTRGYVGKDVHKVDKPTIPEMGGFGILFAFIFGIGFAYPFVPFEYSYLVLAATLSIVLSAFIGIFDDLFELKPINKLILLFIASIPLVITRAGDTFITIPLFGSINLGIFYYLVFVPLFFNVFANMTNFLAGYNGLEAGLGLITSFFIILFAIIQNNWIVLAILIPYTFALLGFYLHNKYPAKVFPGDVGTLTIGATFAAVGIIGHIELVVILLTLLYLFNFSLYFIYKFFYAHKLKESKISGVDKNGILTRMYFPNKTIHWNKLYFLFEHWFYPLTEQGLVIRMYIIHIILSLIGFGIIIGIYF